MCLYLCALFIDSETVAKQLQIQMAVFFWISDFCLQSRYASRGPVMALLSSSLQIAGVVCSIAIHHYGVCMVSESGWRLYRRYFIIQFFFFYSFLLL